MTTAELVADESLDLQHSEAGDIAMHLPPCLCRTKPLIYCTDLQLVITCEPISHHRDTVSIIERLHVDNLRKSSVIARLAHRYSICYDVTSI